MKKTKVLFAICVVGLVSLMVSCSNTTGQDSPSKASATSESGSNVSGDATGTNGSGNNTSGGTTGDNGENNNGNNPTEYIFHETVEYLPAGTDGTAGTTGTYVLFGDWPQTIKAQNVEIDTTKTMTRGGFTFYLGNDLNWYVHCRENAYEEGYTYSDGTAVALSTVQSDKYFKVEPIKWRVLNPNPSNGEKRILFSEKCLIANIPFYNSKQSEEWTTGKVNNQSIYANNYKFSNVRAYLNGIPNQFITEGFKENEKRIDWSGIGFLQSAFTNSAISLITDTLVKNDLESTDDSSTKYICDNTTDKIFLLSCQEMNNSAYGFVKGKDEKKKRESTDYTKANYCVSSCHYFLRSPTKITGDSGSSVAGATGQLYTRSVYESYTSLAPALSLN